MFSEWSFIRGSLLKRSDYIFSKLLEQEIPRKDLFGEGNSDENRQLSLEQEPPSDEGEFLKKTITHYRRVQYDE